MVDKSTSSVILQSPSSTMDIRGANINVHLQCLEHRVLAEGNTGYSSSQVSMPKFSLTRTVFPANFPLAESSAAISQPCQGRVLQVATFSNAKLFSNGNNNTDASVPVRQAVAAVSVGSQVVHGLESHVQLEFAVPDAKVLNSCIMHSTQPIALLLLLLLLLVVVVVVAMVVVVLFL